MTAEDTQNTENEGADGGEDNQAAPADLENKGQGEEENQDTVQDEVSIYKPDGLPDHMVGKTDQETIDNINKAYKGLRKTLGEGKSLPDSPDAYEYDFGDMAEKIVKPGEDGKDPVLSHMNSIFHEKGISNADAQDLVLELYKVAETMGGDIAAAQSEETLDFEFKSMGGVEKAQPTLDAVSMWTKSLDEKGLLSDAVKDEVSLLITHSSGLELLNVLRVQNGEEPIPSNMNNSTPKGEQTQDDLNSMMRDPKYWRDKDPAFIKKVTEGFQKLYKSD